MILLFRQSFVYFIKTCYDNNILLLRLQAVTKDLILRGIISPLLLSPKNPTVSLSTNDYWFDVVQKSRLTLCQTNFDVMTKHIGSTVHASSSVNQAVNYFHRKVRNK